MFNKSIAFGLLAASLMIAPSAALAQQRQDNVQFNEQNGAAVNGSVNTQNATNTNVQKQIQERRGNYYGRHGVRRGVGATRQNQGSEQGNVQNGSAVDGSINEQNGENTNRQIQRVRAR